MDLFVAYFRRAGLDGDDRISGNEAVAFFQGSGLPKQVLAQWARADQRRTGFVGRAEFYNALRIVTVAQSKRELTPEMVKATSYGPAAAKIPAPKINLAATPAPQFNSAAAAPDFHGGAVTLTSSRNLGFWGPQVTPQYNSAGATLATQGGAVTPTSCQNLGSGAHKYNLSLILLQAMLCLMYPIFFNLQIITLTLAMQPGDLHLLPTPIAPPHSEEKRQANQQKPRVPELEKHLVNQLTAEEVHSLNSKF